MQCFAPFVVLKDSTVELGRAFGKVVDCQWLLVMQR